MDNLCRGDVKLSDHPTSLLACRFPRVRRRVRIEVAAQAGGGCQSLVAGGRRTRSEYIADQPVEVSEQRARRHPAAPVEPGYWRNAPARGARATLLRSPAQWNASPP